MKLPQNTFVLLSWEFSMLVHYALHDLRVSELAQKKCKIPLTIIKLAINEW